ncbi:uncharacterized protein [Lolium perenne]|uniref:uncharacterized protein isoform X3 n=1 Tax=Lolium perenne TaxID=4522 RepID=UPI0021F58F6F|nr:uncharacterized protein LOC127336288 isoform X3 [Lolium perenne]
MSHSPLVLPSFLRHGLIPPPPIYLSHGRSLISRSRRSLGARLRSPFAGPRMVDRGRRRPISPPRGRWPLPLRQHRRPSSIPVQSDSAGRHTEELAGIRQGGVHDQLLELLQSHHIHWHYSPSAWSSAFDAMEAMAAVRTDSTCVAERKIPKDNSIKMPSHVNSVVGATASGLERARGKADSGVGLWSTRDLIYLIVYQWISAAGQRCSRDGRGQSFEDGVYLRWYQQIVLHDSFRSRRYHILKEILIMACTSRVPVDLGGFSAAATCATII